MVAAGAGAPSRRRVFASQEMQKVRGLQFRHSISLACFVDQKRKGDAGFVTKHPRVMAVAQSNGGKGGSFVAEGLLVFAQLRYVLAAKNSPVVPQKNQNGRSRGPQRAKTNGSPIAIGKGDLGESAVEGIFHASSILSSGSCAVKHHACGFYVSTLDTFISSARRPHIVPDYILSLITSRQSSHVSAQCSLRISVLTTFNPFLFIKVSYTSTVCQLHEHAFFDGLEEFLVFAGGEAGYVGTAE
jgi:hypothetical protein